MNKISLLKCKALNKYGLHAFLQTHNQDENFAVFDRNRISSSDDLKLFFLAMATEYGWDYSEPAHSTIYFSRNGNDTYAGVYNFKRFCAVTKIKI